MTTRVTEGESEYHPEQSPQIAVIISNFRDREHIERCLESLAATKGPPFVTVVVDCLTPDIEEIVRRHLPNGTVVHYDVDIGATAGRNAAAALVAGRVRYIVFLDNDVTLCNGWLECLVRAAESKPQGAAFQSVALLASNDAQLNSRGGRVNYLLFGWPSGLGEPHDRVETREVDFCSGCSVLVRTEAWSNAGGFDGRYFLYCDDLDLGLRLGLLGYKSYIVGDSIVIHDYEFSPSPRRMFYLQRNRWFTILKLFPLRCMLMVAPMILLTEVGLLLYSIRGGWTGAYHRANLEVLQRFAEFRNDLRESSDPSHDDIRGLISRLDPSFDFSELTPSFGLRLFRSILKGYHAAFLAKEKAT